MVIQRLGLWPVVVTALLCFVVGNAVAQERPTAPADSQAALRERYDALFQQMLNDPANLDLMFEFANVATQLGEYEPAISTLERMLIFNPDLPRVRLELGALYFRLGAYAVAESYFAQVAEDPETPPAVRQRIAEFREEISRRSARSQFSGRLNTGFRHQSNANGGPAAGTVRVFGLTGELDDQFTAQSDYNWFGSGVLRHTYDLGTRTGSWLETTGQVYVSRQFEQTDVDLTVLQIDSGPRMALTEDGMGGSTIRPYVTHSYVQLGSDRLYVEAGGGVDFGFPLDERVYLSAVQEVVYRDHGSLWTERDGLEVTTEATLTLQAFEQLQFDLLGWVLHDDARADYEENNEVATFVSAALTLDPGVSWLQGPWLIRPYAGVIKRTYDAPDPTIDPTTARKDLELRFGLVSTLEIDETFGLQFSVSRTDNDSNLPNFEYTNDEVALSLSVRF